jgi:uncharacterized protein YceH (UPF0502 family)
MPDLPLLEPADQRVLGALMEKQVTVPASYPLSLNALHTACNQATSREPVTDYPASEVEAIARRLKERGLLRTVWAGGGSRVLRYHQLLDEVLDLDVDEKALITVLLLRGAQAPGELKTRTERLHPFRDREQVEACLAGLAARAEPLVRQLARRPGQHDQRWIHLLGPVPGDLGPEPTAEVDRDSVLANGAGARDARVRAAYDACAVGYADALTDDLDTKPFDRWLIAEVAAAATGPILDVGTGPGQVAAALAAAGAEVTALDLSPAMVEQARLRHPGLVVEVGDFTRVLRPPHAPAWGAITAWNAFVHVSDSELPQVLSALGRVLDPTAPLAFCVWVGEEIRHTDQWYGAAVDVDIVFHDPGRVLAAVEAAGFGQVQWYLRSALPGETAAQHLYVVARRMAAAG